MNRTLAVAAVVLASRVASADGERTPMYGIAVVGAESARSTDQHVELAGVAFDLVWWHGRFGLGAEGSARWTVDAEAAREVVLGGSARVQIVERMLRSFTDPRDVELGVELQAIVERAWWNVDAPATDPMAYGLGAAVRLRGGGDLEGEGLLAESRAFLRVMSSRWTELDLARTTMPVAPPERALTVLFGIGGSWGIGEAAYMQRFRRRTFEPILMH